MAIPATTTTNNSEVFSILFIKPHTPTTYQMIEIPLGIMCLSAFLKESLGTRIKIELLDMRICRDPEQALLSCLKRIQPRLIGISMQVYEQSFLQEYMAVLTDLAPEAHIIVGGPYATYYYEDFLEDHRIRCAVQGEGEMVLLKLVRRMIEGRDYFDLDGIAWHKGEETVCNPREPYIENLDALPFPDYSLVKFSDYWQSHVSMNMILADKRYVQLMSSRACPYNCAYCHNIFGKKLRQRSPENMVAEIQMLYEQYGVREFQFVDDVFNFDRRRMHAFLQLIIRNELDIKIAFPNGLRADLLEPDDLDLMRQAGVYMVTFAIESGSQRIQRMIRKNLNIAKVMENVRYAKQIGLITKGFFMLGFPGEQEAEIRQTVNLALDSEFDLISLFNVIPFYGTELFEMAQKIYPEIRKNAYDNYISRRSFYEDATGFNLNALQKRTYIFFYTPLRLERLFRKAPMRQHLMKYFFYAVWEVLKN